mmetsp:Transcript_77126/g.121798  ORF Transcript_77126/g.121798 Transcript_77126/m.121798 type:complete len:576 (-) Transcript_77126:50-1777(-)
MQIPPQEEWSLELLNELQRAVPVLESSSFHLDDDDDDDDPDLGLDIGGQSNLASQSLGSSSHGWVSPSDAHPDVVQDPTDQQWLEGWGLRNAENEASATFGVFTDDAMALPMSTLTSGKRKTYPNKSTFQAHVCCVMDPAQVPRVLQTLQASPHYQSVRFWPYAYRIISPYDGQAHEGSCDGNDSGAGEKMLALLTRMKLENLLLMVSRWDTGPPNRLGCELFRCLNEECKELLRELQQAVRASFPPEELMRTDFVQNSEDSTAIEKSGGESTSFCTDAECTTQWDEAEFTACPGSEEAPRHVGRLFDMQPINLSAARGTPQRFRLASGNVFDRSARHRSARFKRAAQVAALRQAALHDEPMTDEEVTLEKAALRNAHIEIVQRSGLVAGRCPIGERAKNSRQQGALSTQTATTSMSVEEQSEQASQMNMGRKKTLEETCLLGLYGQMSTEGSHEINEEEVLARQREAMSRMTSEDLLRVGARLRGDRLALEDCLGTLCKAAEVFRGVCTSSCEGSSETSQQRKSLKSNSPLGLSKPKQNGRSLQFVRKPMVNGCRSLGDNGHLRQAGSSICASR